MSLGGKKAALELQAITRLGAFKRGTRQYKSLHWPVPDDHQCGEDCPLRFKMRVLTRAEQQECHAAAHVRFDDDLHLNPNETVNLPVYSEEIKVQFMFRALRDHNDPESTTFAESAADLRANTEADELDTVFEKYIDFQQEIDPDGKSLPPEIIEQMRDLVKKKDAKSLRGCGSTALVNFILFLDSQPPTSPTGSS